MEKMGKFVKYKEKYMKLMILMQLKLFAYPKSIRHGQTHALSMLNIARNQNIFSLEEL